MDIGESFIRMTAALGVVLGVMMAMAFMARRVLGGRWLPRPRASLVQIVSTAYLGPRKTISIVDVAGEFFLVGATSTDMVNLGRISDQDGLRRTLASTSGSMHDTRAHDAR
ncbi:MAG TPA: flagellar biosynthetic protein FliO [Nitrospiraceae bacterium]|nr:flagellar biosynthetic protein FliO [Nitrospiraceae bacterium]